jgi:hypothetical protein
MVESCNGPNRFTAAPGAGISQSVIGLRGGTPRNHGYISGTDKRFVSCTKSPERLRGPPSLFSVVPVFNALDDTRRQRDA